MIGMGDEIGRTQQGNNNAYCQDNALSWMDWDLVDSATDLRRFVAQLIAYRMHRDVVLDHDDFTLNQLLSQAQVVWHGVELNQPDWSDDSRSFALTFTSVCSRFRLHLMANAWWEPLTFVLPDTGDGYGAWRCWIDTAMTSPGDSLAWDDLAPLAGDSRLVTARSIQVVRVGLGP